MEQDFGFGNLKSHKYIEIILIQQTLRKMKYGDYLLYADTGCKIYKDLAKIMEGLEY